jgi:hypothetical protein
MTQRITAVKKSSLAGLSEGWGDECYAILRPTQYDDLVALDELQAKGQKDQVTFQTDLARSHFVTGKIKTWNVETGEQELVTMTADDVDCSVEVLDRLFADIIGIDVDPKDMRAAVAQELKQQHDAAATGTPSSTASPATSEKTSPES